MSRNQACSHHGIGADNTLPRESLDVPFLDETPGLKARLDDEEFGPRFRLLEAVSDADWTELQVSDAGHISWMAV